MGQVDDKRPWYSVTALADGAEADSPVEILIYDEISPIWGVSAADFVRDLAAIDASEITVRINSPGGSVFEGIAILNALRGHPAQITTVVDSLAASIASVIMLGGDRVVMNKNSTVMVHNAWNVVAGNADELQKAADTLRGFSANIASIYAEKAGGSVEDWQAIMDAETWYTADEAVTAGLADEAMAETAKPSAAASYARASFDLSKFKYSGREAAPAPIILARNKTPLSVKAEVNQGKEPAVATLNESLVEKLGLDAEADDDAIIAKVVELNARPEKEEPAPEPGADQITSAAAKLDMAVLPKAQLAEMQAALTDLQGVRAAQVASENERILSDAIAKGKFGPASKASFAKLMEVDPVGTRATIVSLPENLIPVAEMGHGLGSELDHLDAEMAGGYAKLTGRTFGKDA